jgi:S-adenosylmethionine:tRNA ribosyltransferase-isomerase
LQQIKQSKRPRRKLTLHVGAGTFQPVRGETIEAHRMHKERYHIPGETLELVSEKAGARRGHDLAARARDPMP